MDDVLWADNKIFVTAPRQPRYITIITIQLQIVKRFHQTASRAFR